MTREQKIQYLRIALSLQKFTIYDEICDRIIETYEAVLEKEGNFSVHCACEIEAKMNTKYAVKPTEVV